MRERIIKQAALLLTLVHLFLLIDFMTMGLEGHALTHRERPDHASQHASLVCNWICTASTFVHSEDQHLNRRFHPFFEKLIIAAEPFFGSFSFFPFYIRPPPFSLA